MTETQRTKDVDPQMQVTLPGSPCNEWVGELQMQVTLPGSRCESL